MDTRDATNPPILRSTSRPMYYIMERDTWNVPPGPPKVRPVDDAKKWATYFGRGDERRVASSHVILRLCGRRLARWWVSTVFLGLDHNYGPYGDALIFETMVFSVRANDKNLRGELYCFRTSTWDEALTAHAHATHWALQEINPIRMLWRRLREPR